MSGYRLKPAGDTTLIVEFGDRIDRVINDAGADTGAGYYRGKARRRDRNRSDLSLARGLLRSAAADRSANCSQAIETLLARPKESTPAGRLWRLPVCYDTSLAPDLDDVAAATGLSAAQVIERHSAETYHVYMLGFLPGQAYLGDLPARTVVAAAALTASESRRRLRRHRHDHDLHIPAGDALRLASDRRVAGAALADRPRCRAAAATGRQGALRSDFAARISSIG